MRMRNNMLRCCVLLLGFFVFFSTQALAGVIFSDDFEGVTAVTWPDNSVDADPVASVGTWTVTETSQADIQVSSNITAAGGSNYLTLARRTTAEIYTVFSSPVDTSNVLTLSYDVYFDSATVVAGKGMNIGLRNGGALNTLDQLVYSSTGGGFRIMQNAVTHLGGDYYALDEWHHMELAFDLAADTYSITIDATTYSDFAFKADTDLATWVWIAGSAADADANFFLDNIEASVVPEPATLGVFILGGSSLFLLRRSRMARN